MRLVKLPANNAWVFLFGDKPVPMAPDNRTFFDTRAEAVQRAKLLGLAVDKAGELSAVHDEFTDKRIAKRVAKRNPRKKRAKRVRRSNPGWYIHIQRGGHGHAGVGPVMLFNGKSFSNRPDSKPLPFTSSAAAMYKARHLLGKYPKLDKYKIWVSDQFAGAPTVDTRVNPSRRPNPAPAELDEAAQKLEDFTGRPATQTMKASPRSDDKTGLVFGELDLIGYRAKREGIDGGPLTRFVHKFRKGSRPLLAVSTDGKQLHVVGGQYEFTDAGIEDR